MKIGLFQLHNKISLWTACRVGFELHGNHGISSTNSTKINVSVAIDMPSGNCLFPVISGNSNNPKVI